MFLEEWWCFVLYFSSELESVECNVSSLALQHLTENLKFFQAPDDIDGLIKNEEVDPSTVPTDAKGRKKKKYLGKILYKV